MSLLIYECSICVGECMFLLEVYVWRWYMELCLCVFKCTFFSVYVGLCVRFCSPVCVDLSVRFFCLCRSIRASLFSGTLSYEIL